MAALTDINSIITEDQIKETFEKYDEDGGGSLDYHEIQTLFSSMPLLSKIVSRELIVPLIKDIDVNGDGDVDTEEFQAMVYQAIFQLMLKGANP